MLGHVVRFLKAPGHAAAAARRGVGARAYSDAATLKHCLAHLLQRTHEVDAYVRVRALKQLQELLEDACLPFPMLPTLAEVSHRIDKSSMCLPLGARPSITAHPSPAFSRRLGSIFIAADFFLHAHALRRLPAAA